MSTGEFLAVPEHTGLILCADGVPLFKSSKGSFWPVLLMITSLPPDIRMNADNIILAGVWQGPVKPPMNIILPPVRDKTDHLRRMLYRFKLVMVQKLSEHAYLCPYLIFQLKLQLPTCSSTMAITAVRIV